MGHVRATLILPLSALVLGAAVVAIGEAGATDTRERVRAAELATLQAEADQAARSIARRFDEIRAIYQAEGDAGVGLSTEDLLTALDEGDTARAQAQVSALLRAAPPEVRGMSVGGGGRNAAGLYRTGAAAYAETVAPATDRGIVRMAPGSARHDGIFQSGPRAAVFDELILKTTGRRSDEHTAPYVLGSELGVFLIVPVIGPDGRQRGAFSTDIDVSYLMLRVGGPGPAPSKRVYVVDGQRQLISYVRSGLIREDELDIATSEAVGRIIAGGKVEGAADTRDWLLASARTPTLQGARPDLTLDVGWYVIVARSVDAVHADVDAALGQLKVARGALAGVLLLAGIALGFVLDTALRQRRLISDASRQKSAFLANMSHELRTPLNAVIGFADVLEGKLFGELNAKQSEYVRDISTSGKHLLELVNEILDLSKVEAGRMELERTDFDVGDMIRGTLAFVRERAERHGIELAADVPDDIGSVTADERKVRQVVLNLLSNAVKFTPDGGWIGVTARRHENEIQVSVRDTGVGIAPEDHAKVFEEFRQFGGRSERSQEGTGLGLALAKRFVELHGGRIWFESEIRKGTTFTIALPASAPVLESRTA